MPQKPLPPQRPIACLLHGFIGVGKTTLARRLESERRFVRLSPDEWMTRLFGDDPPAAGFKESFTRVTDLQEQLMQSVLRAGASTVIDAGFWPPEDRSRVRRLVEECGAVPWIVSLTCADKVAFGRVEKRNEALAGSLHISNDTYATLQERFVPIGHAEQADVRLDTAEVDLREIDLDRVLPAGAARHDRVPTVVP